METNIIFAITAVVVVLAAVIVTYGFGPKKRNEFIIDLFEAVGEPVPQKSLKRIASPRRKRDVGLRRNSGSRKTSWAVALGCT